MALLRSSLTKALSVARCFSTAGWSGGALSSGLASSSAPATSTLSRACTDSFGRAQNQQCASWLVQTTWIPSRSMASGNKLKRRKENVFDMTIQREKKVQIVYKIRAILATEPRKTMTLLRLGRYRGDIGLTGKRRVVVILRRYPAVFEMYEESGNVMYVRFTARAEAQFEEERRLILEQEPFHVEKLRKLLMMSNDKRLTLDRIAHFKYHLGLPDDFQTRLIPRYPQFFKVVDAATGPALELTVWDPLLAISAAEKKAAAEPPKVDERPKIVIDGEEVVSSALGNRTLNLPKGLNLTRKERAIALRFQEQPYVSPYADATGVDPASIIAEKGALSVVHELLSLTLEKRTLVDHLTHLKKDFRFPQSIRAALIRHPEMFYVSFKGKRDTVFLREAYEKGELLDKSDPMFLAKERLRSLVEFRREPSKGSGRVDRPQNDGDQNDHDEEFDDQSDLDGDSEDESGSDEDREGGNF